MELQIAQMYSPLASSNRLLVSVVALQPKSPCTINCRQLYIAAAYHVVKGDDLAEITFDESKLREHLEQFTPLSLASPKTTVHRAEQQNVLIKINCSCGCPDTVEDMVVCDGCDKFFYLSCVDMEF